MDALAPAAMTGSVVFACPLCRLAGRVVPLIAELERAMGDLVTVVDLSGCPHAGAFGTIKGLTVLEERHLIEAALAAWEASGRAARMRRP